jgi:hypothetical protein
MDTLWLAVLLKCVSPRWVLRLWVASLVIRVLAIIGILIFLYQMSQIRW